MVGPLGVLTEEGEDIHVQVIAIVVAYHLLKDGKITYVPAIIALQWFQLNASWVQNTWIVE
jgi:ADP-ribose pyrophosphatase